VRLAVTTAAGKPGAILREDQRALAVEVEAAAFTVVEAVVTAAEAVTGRRTYPRVTTTLKTYDMEKICG